MAIYNPEAEDDGVIVDDPSAEGFAPPPTYTEALDQDEGTSEEPPTYNETLSRIRQQLPKLSRSISESAQKLGRQMSVKHTATAPSVERQCSTPAGTAARTIGGSLRETRKTAKRQTFQHSASMIEEGSA